MDGRIVVVGATGGIGEAIAKALATAGRPVVLVGRSAERLTAARRRIAAAVPDAELHLERADLADLAQVRDLAARIAAGPPPAAVINNAAVVADPTEPAPGGLPRVLVVNQLAPYLLLRSLVEPLRGRDVRFVVVGADPNGLRRVPVDLDDLTMRGLRFPIRSMRPFAAYARTKNMNAMLVYALARRLAGTGITVNGVHPGIISGTGLNEGARGALKVFGAVLSRFTPGPEVGADTPVWLATAPEVAGITGRFFVRRAAVPTAAHTTDRDRCDRLWNECAELTAIGVAL